jgi:hypothetical protein
MQAMCGDAMMRDYKSFGRGLIANKARGVICHGNVRYPHLRKTPWKDSLLRNYSLGFVVVIGCVYFSPRSFRVSSPPLLTSPFSHVVHTVSILDWCR